MIVVTGATKSIGCAVIARLNEEQYKDIIAVDDYPNQTAQECPEKRSITHKITRANLLDWLDQSHQAIQIILDCQPHHQHSENLWKKCIQYGLPFIYVSAEESEQGFDLWVRAQESQPYFWAGLRFGSPVINEAPAVVMYFMSHRKDSGQYSVTGELIQNLHISTPSANGLIQ